METETFECAQCHGIFEKEWTDAEAQAESASIFGAVPTEALAVICDDCWQRLMAGGPAGTEE